METLQAIWGIFAAFKPFLPILLIALGIGFVRIWITDGIKYALRIYIGIFLVITAMIIGLSLYTIIKY